MSSRTRIVAVGDVHGAWGDGDVAALSTLAPDLVIFVGDIGNEDVELVRKINECPYPTLIMLGNHDAWTCLTKKRLVGQWGAEDDPAARVRQQLELNGERNLAWNCKQLEGRPISVVGARPFSKGGGQQTWAQISDFYKQLYDCPSFEESSSRVVRAAREAPASHAMVMVGHNGPSGLGDRAAALCGADFLPKGGDWGDPDLRAALNELRSEGRAPALLLVGHMHDQLRTGGRRTMLVLDNATAVLNTAVVPRHRPDPRHADAIQSHFTVCEFEGAALRSAEFVWMGLRDPGASGAMAVVESQPLLRKAGDGGWEVFDTHTSKWDRSKFGPA